MEEGEQGPDDHHKRREPADGAGDAADAEVGKQVKKMKVDVEGPGSGLPDAMAVDVAAARKRFPKPGDEDFVVKRKAKRPNRTSKMTPFREERSSPAEFYFENGLRKVKPYWYIHRVHAKGRWLGKTLFDVFCTEFRDQTPEYYRGAIECGKISVNGKQVDTTYLVRNEDLISHATHRHEPPVTAAPITIVHRDDTLLVINKPASVPVHPTGRYNHNSVVGILCSPEHGFSIDALFPANRIDRLTSGVLLIALTKGRATELMTCMQEREVGKEYLCRVKGKFPVSAPTPAEGDQPPTASRPGVVVCREPIKTVSHTFSVNMVAPDGKPCETEFERLSYNGITSVVRCKPITGRTHQIRVHLQYLGHPIADDPLYCTDAWGPEMGAFGHVDGTPDDVIARLKDTCFPLQSELGQRAPSPTSFDEQPPVPVYPPPGPDDLMPTAVEGKTMRFGDFPCVECGVRRLDPLVDQQRIFLHSWRYKIPSLGLDVETERPDWAEDDFNGDRILQERFWKFGGRWDGRLSGNVVPS
ncbi:RNA pseudouridylate synthase domain containing protein 2 [Irineochytrium annulatum]|nr:RNA pseudouridylate synthase domain containing protein 2 [Irineochytrium annulatum]